MDRDALHCAMGALTARPTVRPVAHETACGGWSYLGKGVAPAAFVGTGCVEWIPVLWGPTSPEEPGGLPSAHSTDQGPCAYYTTCVPFHYKRTTLQRLCPAVCSLMLRLILVPATLCRHVTLGVYAGPGPWTRAVGGCCATTGR